MLFLEKKIRIKLVRLAQVPRSGSESVCVQCLSL